MSDFDFTNLLSTAGDLAKSGVAEYRPCTAGWQTTLYPRKGGGVPRIIQGGSTVWLGMPSSDPNYVNARTADGNEWLAFGPHFMTGSATTVRGVDADTFVGPMTPEQLSRLDRALTPAEQTVVSNWQAMQANADLTAQRKQGGPMSSTVAVTPQGATLKPAGKKVVVAPRAQAPILEYGPPLPAGMSPMGVPQADKENWFVRKVPGLGMATWQVMLGSVGLVMLGTGVFLAAKGIGGTHRRLKVAR